MAVRLYRKVAVLAKIEAAYGVDAVPTGGANAMLMTDVRLVFAGGEEERGLLTPSPALGHQGVIPVGEYIELEGSVEMAAAGAAGTAPAWGPLMRACGLDETISAGVSVAYQPVSADYESATIWFNADGVNHKMLGARGSFSLDLSSNKIPRFRFSFKGLSGGRADAALPAVTLTGFKKPLPVNKANTTFSLGGVAQVMEALSIDLGVSTEPRLLVGSDSVLITDRKATGQTTVEAKLLAAQDWFATHEAMATVALALAHGTTAGKIVEIAAPAVQVGRPAQGQSQGILNYALPLMFTPSAGDDELVITVK